MNRIIKFRAWDSIDKFFLSDSSFFLMADGTLWLNMGNGEEVPALEGRFQVMQFTGLLDKNGKEIYEGDIVMGKNNVGWEIKWFDDISTGEGEFCGFNMSKFDREYYEVIGNIFENPEIKK